ncbi:MAG: LptF/LptG family permease [Gemmatimonadota bacterium]|jgi:lipopolysaccharide export system permease protein
MRILISYLIRAHVGPFLFALSTLTGLLFLNAVAQRLENLAGKGLTWDVIWEFLVLSLPHTVALTLPMAVLVAVLYAFSDLTANNEITAMKAGGVRPQRVMLPLIGVGVVIGGVMLLFNDYVLPQANHRLRNLLLDINRKSPTFILREQVVNEVRAGDTGDVYYLTAATIDNQTNELHDVAIYDGNDPLDSRTTYATRGQMAFNEARTDLYLTLYDGVVFETAADREGDFQQIRYEKQVLPIRGVGNELERRAGGAERSDREMTLAMLDSAATDRAQKLDSARDVSAEIARYTVLQALGREDVATASENGAGRRPTPPTTLPSPAISTPPATGTDGAAPRQLEEDRELLARDEVTRQAYIRTNTQWAISNSHRSRVNSYRVEIHKKFTLAFACVVFVLLGGPLAIRFPRGGLGLVIAASSGIFSVYWAGLIGGENLADNGVAPPAITMWVPNLVFGALGLWLFMTMGRESATARGGGWDDLYWTVRKSLTAPFRAARRDRVAGGVEGGEARA